MKVEKTSLEGVLLIKPELFSDGQGEVSLDPRGAFIEIYNESKYKIQGIDIAFVEDDISISQKDVLRGLHANNETWKLMTCLHGKIFFVAVDCRKEAATFGKWESFDLNDENKWRILVPPMYGCGYLALAEKIIFQYKQSTYYSPGTQSAYRWDDPKFGIHWPVKNPILSPRDASVAYIDAK